jgi:hypothetical protein
VGLIAPAKWEEIGCSGNVPVETDGAAGNAGAHWDEACMGEELKTGYANSKMLFPKSRLDRILRRLLVVLYDNNKFSNIGRLGRMEFGKGRERIARLFDWH